MFFFSCFLVSNLYCQQGMPLKHVDSIFKSVQVSDNDWMISLSIETGGFVPLYDSLGNLRYDYPEGTFLLLNVRGNQFLQKIWYDHHNIGQEPTIQFGGRSSLNKNSSLGYSVDSLMLANKESIYPFVFKDSAGNGYNVRYPSSHETHYWVYFKTARTEGSMQAFTEQSLKRFESFIEGENLNYLYNSSTFVYRSFLKVLSLVKENLKMLDNK